MLRLINKRLNNEAEFCQNIKRLENQPSPFKLIQCLNVLHWAMNLTAQGNFNPKCVICTISNSHDTVWDPIQLTKPFIKENVTQCTSFHFSFIKNVGPFPFNQVTNDLLKKKL